MTTTASPAIHSNLDAADWGQLQPLFDALLVRPINSPAELERWLLDVSALDEQIDEAYARRMIAHTCHTDDPAIEKAYLDFVENVLPKVKPIIFELQKKFAASTYHDKLERRTYFVLTRS